MKKLKNLLFPQKGKEKSVIRLYIVLIYIALILGTIFTFVESFIDTERQNLLHANTVQTQLSWALLDKSITSETVRLFHDSKVFKSEKDLSQFNNGYEYEFQLLYTDIPNLASEAEDVKQAENIRKVGDILEQNIENFSSARSKVFTPSSAMIEGLLNVLIIGIPFFIFFRAVIYRIILYIIFGKEKVK